MKSTVYIYFSICLLIFSSNLSKAQIDTSGYLEMGNQKIFYETAGTGPVIIFIHDGLIHREVWEKQFIPLSKGFKVIRYDSRGFGNSTPGTEPYSNVEDLVNLFNQLKIDTACLIALSAGARLAIDFTLKYPEMVNSLVLAGPVVGGFPFTQHFNTRGGLLPVFDASDVERVRDQMREYYACHDPWTVYRKNRIARKEVIKLVKRFPRRGMSPDTNIPPSQPSYLRLNEIKIPVLILVGEYDIPDVHAHAGIISAGIANSKKEIVPKAGHLIPIEKPGLFNEAVLRFLNEFIN